VIKSEPLSSPFEKETIVVQSRGMERWLSMRLAEYLGVWANGDFPFPNKIVWDMFKKTFDSLPDTSKFRKESMMWSLMEALELRNQELGIRNQGSDFQIPHPYAYLKDDFNGVKLFQLASRIADVFDQYMIFRPEEIEVWEKGKQADYWQDNEHATWQATLWQALIQRHGKQHRATLRREFLQSFQYANDGFDAPTLNTEKLPKRLSIFGIPTLPPSYLDIFVALSTVIEIRLFLLNPCQMEWGQIVSEKEKSRRERFISEDGHFEVGNSLLASMGKTGRDFFDIIQGIQDKIHYAEHNEFEESADKTLLSFVQADILNLLNRSEIGEKTRIDNTDNSIQIHVCHSPMREIEVLHDQLLALFDSDSTLRPNDVLVMTPDIEKYAPLIQAVFASVQDEKQQIPFSIADRSLRSQSVLIDAFLAILELNKSRLTVNGVLAILEMDVVHRHFGLLPQDLELAKKWIEHVGIRWGVDGQSRQRLDLPEFEENTWRAGLNRLLLGTALMGQNAELFHGILPFDDIEGSDTLILGKLVNFIETLFEYLDSLEKWRNLSAWAEFLRRILDTFLDADDNNENQAQRIRKILDDLEKNAVQVNFEKTVSIDVILSYLRDYLEKDPQPTNFLTGKVTFCTLLPMRSIPFKIIYLLGMNDSDYPRRDRPVDFDLMEQYKKRGDRSKRDTDRYLFLESLLSVRKSLYISYVGLDIQNNTVIPPSVLVNELIDYSQRHFFIENQSISEHLIIKHPLQAYSSRYFNKNNARLFSYSRELCEVSKALSGERERPAIFIENPLPEPAEEWKTVDIQRLIEFFKHPVKFLLKERLGIVLKTKEENFDEKEPFEINNLESYKMNQNLAERYLKQENVQNFHAVFKASGQLPHGEMGKYVYSELNDRVRIYVANVQKATQEAILEPCVVNLIIGDMRLTGSVNRIRRDNLVHHRCAKIKAKDYIELWIYHLMLNYFGTRNRGSGIRDQGSGIGDRVLPRSSVLITENAICHFKPVDNAEEILKKLLNLYWQGLTSPLSFFPESSLIYAETLAKGKSEDYALSQALFKWNKNCQHWCESDDEYYQLCFKQMDNESLFNQTFKDVATTFFEPLLVHS